MGVHLQYNKINVNENLINASGISAFKHAENM